MREAKRAISLFTVICMLACMMPFMQPVNYDSFAGTYMVTDMVSGAVPLSGEGYYLDDGNGSITAEGASSENYDMYFNPTENKIVFNGVNLRRVIMLQETEAGKDFTIEVHGDNSVTFKTLAIGRAYTASGSDGRLIINGDGTLDISLTSEAAILDRTEFAALQSTGDIIIGGDVSLKCTAVADATVTSGRASTVYGGIYSVQGRIIIKDNATVEARGMYAVSEDSAVRSYGVYANAGVEVTDNATLKAYSGDVSTTGSGVRCESMAIYAENGNITIGENATVIAEGGNAIVHGNVDDATKLPISAGVYVKTGSVNVNGTLDATAEEAKGHKSNSETIGKTYGIYAGGDINFNGFTVAKGGETDAYVAAVYSAAGNITVGTTGTVKVTGGSVEDCVQNSVLTNAIVENGSDGIAALNGSITISGNAEVYMPDSEVVANGICATGNISLPGTVKIKVDNAADQRIGIVSASGSISVSGNVDVEIGDCDGNITAILTVEEDIDISGNVTITTGAVRTAGTDPVVNGGIQVGSSGSIKISGTVNVNCGDASGDDGFVAAIWGDDIIISGEVNAVIGVADSPSFAIRGEKNIYITGSALKSGAARSITAEVAPDASKGCGIWAQENIVVDVDSEDGKVLTLHADGLYSRSGDLTVRNAFIESDVNIGNTVRYGIYAQKVEATNAALWVDMTGAGDTTAGGIGAENLKLNDSLVVVYVSGASSTDKIIGLQVADIEMNGADNKMCVAFITAAGIRDAVGIWAITMGGIENADVLVAFNGDFGTVTGICAAAPLNIVDSVVEVGSLSSPSPTTVSVHAVGIKCAEINVENSDLEIDFGGTTTGTESIGIQAYGNVNITGSGVSIVPSTAPTMQAIRLENADTSQVSLASGLHWTTSKAVATTNGAYTWSADDEVLIVSTSAIVPSNGGSHHHSGGASTTTEATTGADGTVTSVEVKVGEKAVADAAAKGEPVKLETSVKAAASSEEAVPVKIELPKSVTPENPVAVEIPVDNMTAGTVAVIVHGDGSEEIVKTSVQGDDGIVLMLEGSETIKVIDNTKNFTDVKGNEWFAGDVAWAASREIMKGIGGGIFDANAWTSRSMISQILFNLDGARATAAQEASAAERFGDVNTTNWFAGSVGWMVANGIAQGRGGDFGANDPVTREQLAVMYFNYAKFIGADTDVRGDVVKFADGSEVSPWAAEALSWAVGKGLIQGTTRADGTVVLDPQGSSTRAMVAAITQRFCAKLF